MRPISRTKAWAVLTLIAAVFGFSPRCFADPITVISSAISTGILDPSSDSVSLDAGGVTVDSDSGPFLFQTGYFLVDYSNIPDQVIAFSLQDTISLNGIVQTFVLQGQDSVTNAADTLLLFADGPFQSGDQVFTMAPFTVTATDIGDFPVQLVGSVVAQVTPEPGSILLLGTGLIAGALVGLKTVRSRSRPPA